MYCGTFGARRPKGLATIMRDVSKCFEEVRALKRRESSPRNDDVALKLSVCVHESSKMANPFFTIGHSTRLLDAFVTLLKDADVRLVVDVRTIPRSRSNSQYNSNLLPASLSAFQIGYEHIAALGGLRGKQPNVSPDTNAFWQNQSFHNYADYAMGADFHAGFSRLRQLGQSERADQANLSAADRF
jgi:Protein of unknown function, DUF488